MKRVKKRAASVLILAGAAILGIIIFIVNCAVNGGKWTSYTFNRSVYTNGVLSRGVVLDRNGVELAGVDENGARSFASDAAVRKATLHAVGDANGNIGTGALKVFSSELSGYDFISGTYTRDGKGDKLTLTISARINVAAYNALNGRKGVAAVFNYETGEILGMVSSPSYDPADPPDIQDGDPNYEGVYLNRFLSSSFVPGSVFKLVTLAAAIENIPDLYDRTFTCYGSMQVGESSVTCTSAHSKQKIEDALANSCNCVFAELALELGSETLMKYAGDYGLLDSMEIDGIWTAKGSFGEAEANSPELAWSGIGQSADTVNPASLLRFIGAIANGGEAVDMKLIKDDSIFGSTGKEQLIDADTAEQLAKMMHYNVHAKYGAENFPNLNISAKSGTAEVGNGEPHAWFAGFIENEGYPLAFVVLVENGGWGSSAAGPVANAMLQAAITE